MGDLSPSNKYRAAPRPLEDLGAISTRSNGLQELEHEEHDVQVWRVGTTRALLLKWSLAILFSSIAAIYAAVYSMVFFRGEVWPFICLQIPMLIIVAIPKQSSPLPLAEVSTSAFGITIETAEDVTAMQWTQIIAFRLNRGTAEIYLATGDLVGLNLDGFSDSQRSNLIKLITQSARLLPTIRVREYCRRGWRLLGRDSLTCQRTPGIQGAPAAEAISGTPTLVRSASLSKTQTASEMGLASTSESSHERMLD